MISLTLLSLVGEALQNSYDVFVALTIFVVKPAHASVIIVEHRHDTLSRSFQEACLLINDLLTKSVEQSSLQ